MIRVRQALKLGEATVADLLIVPDGAISVNLPARLWLAAQLRAIAGGLASSRSALGICLGALLMAASLGASVLEASTIKIGWRPINLTEPLDASPLGVLEGMPGPHWRDDRFELPDGSESLASI